MEPINLIKGARFAEEHVEKELRHNSENMRVVTFNLAKGQVIPPHVAPVEVLMYVATGSGTFTVGDKEHPVDTGSVVVCAPMESHGMSAAEDMVVLAIIAPSP